MSVTRSRDHLQHGGRTLGSGSEGTAGSKRQKQSPHVSPRPPKELLARKVAQVKRESTFKQTFRRGYEARQKKRADQYAYRPYLRDMPSSGSSDSTTSDADSGLSDVEELLDAVGQALTASDYQQSPTREQEISEALNLSFSEDQYFSMSTATKEYETSRFSTQSLGGGGGAPGVDRPGGALRKSHFIDHQAELTAKLDPRDVRLTTPDGFPVRIYRSPYLRQALERFTLKPKVERALRKLVRLPEMKKAFLYIFWIYFAMRFRDGSFAVLDHAMASAATTHCLDVDIGVQERRRIIEQDLEVAHQRRVEFIKQWRAKFQHYFMTLRREQPRLMP